MFARLMAALTALLTRRTLAPVRIDNRWLLALIAALFIGNLVQAQGPNPREARDKGYTVELFTELTKDGKGYQEVQKTTWPTKPGEKQRVEYVILGSPCDTEDSIRAGLGLAPNVTVKMITTEFGDKYVALLAEKTFRVTVEIGVLDFYRYEPVTAAPGSNVNVDAAATYRCRPPKPGEGKVYNDPPLGAQPPAAPAPGNQQPALKCPVFGVTQIQPAPDGSRACIYPKGSPEIEGTMPDGWEADADVIAPNPGIRKILPGEWARIREATFREFSPNCACGYPPAQ